MLCTKLSVTLNVLALCSLAVALPVGASAAKIVVCSTCDPLPIPLTKNNNALDLVQATGQDSVTYEFLNLTGSIITNLVFSTTINTGLSANMLQQDGDFQCIAPDGYFLNCQVDYNSNTGALTYDYFGVNPPNRSDSLGTVIYNDILYNGGASGNTGIPKFGLFSIQLTGWTDNLVDPVTGQTLYSGLPQFQGAFNVPESSAILTLLTELSLFIGAIAIFRRKLSWNRRFDT